MPRLLRRFVADILVDPRDEVFPVRRVGVPAIVLPPRKLAAHHCDIDIGHLFRVVIVRTSEVLRAEQPEYRLRCDCSHKAALMIEPSGVTLLRHSVTYERQPR